MPLKKSDIARFKQRLEDMKRQMTSQLASTSAEVKSPDQATGYSQHQADQGTDDFDRTITVELSRKEYSILQQIERALEKINEGTYGICDITGKEISLARLEAIPYACITVEAAEKMEKGLL